MIVLVFKTSLKDKSDVIMITNYLNSVKDIFVWSVDLDDWEKILRIETTKESLAQQIIQDLNNFGYECEELE